MATRKRLSDLVREEVKKQSDDDGASSQTPAKKTKRQPAKGLKSEGAAKSTAKSSTPSKQTTAKQKTSESTIKLKAKITELESKNKSLSADNSKLLTKISNLEEKLESLDKLAQDIKTSEAKQKSMQLTLDEAKQDALKLAQENQKLLDQIKSLETAQKSTAQSYSMAPARTVPPARVSQTKVIQRANRSSPVVYKAPAKKPFSRPVAPSRMPPQRVVQNSDEFETWCYD